MKFPDLDYTMIASLIIMMQLAAMCLYEAIAYAVGVMISGKTEEA